MSDFNLDFKVDTAQLDKLVQSLDKVKASATASGDGLHKVEDAASFKKINDEAAKLVDSMRKASNEMLNLEKNAGKVKGAFSGVLSSFNPVTLGVGALTSAISVLSLSALSGLVTSTISARAEMFKLSQNTGVSVEVLGGLKKVAMSAGVEFTEVTASIAKFNAAMSASEKEDSVQQQAFKNLGLSIRDSNGHMKDSITLQREAAKALNEHSDGAAKDAYIAALWGKGMVQNKEYIKELGEAQTLQGRITTEQAEKARQLEKDMKQLKIASEEFKKEIANALIPYLSSAVTQMLNLTKAAGGLRGALSNIDLFGTSDVDLRKKLNANVAMQEQAKKNWDRMGSGILGGLTQGNKENHEAYMTKLVEEEKVLRKYIDLQGKSGSAGQDADGSGLAPGAPRPRVQTELKNIKEGIPKVDTGLAKEDPELKAAMARAKAGITEQAALYKTAEENAKLSYDRQEMNERDFILALANAKQLELSADITFTDKAMAVAKTRGDKGKAEYERLLGDRKSYEEQQKAEDMKSLREIEAYARRVNEAIATIKRDGGRQNADRMTAKGRQRDSFTMTANDLADKSRIEDLQTSNARGLEDSAREKKAAGWDQGAIDEAIAAQKKAGDEAVQIERDSIAERKSMQGDWKNGAISAFNEYAEKAKDVAGQTRDAFQNAQKGMEDALVNFVMTGKLNFGDLAKSVLADIARMAAKAAVSGIFKYVVGAMGVTTGAAQGGAFDNGVKMFADGGVVNGPMNFPMQNGTGRVGEAGPEGILPLKRLPNGAMGVQAQGAGGGSTMITNNVTVNVEGGKDSQETADRTSAATLKAMQQVADKQISNAQRPGGMMNKYAANAF